MPADVQGILEGLRIGEQRRQNVIANKLAQQRADQLDEREQERIEEEKNFHKAQTEHQKALLKATEAVHAATRLAELQKIGQGYQQGAPAPPGSQVFEGTPDAQGNQTNTLQLPIESDQQVPGIVGNIPLPTTPMQVQSPDTYARQSAARQEVANAPAIAKANAIEAQKAADALAKQKELLDANEKRRVDNEKFLIDRQAAHDKTLENIAAGHDRARERSTTPSALPGTVLANYLNQAREGQVTLDEVKKMVPAKEQPGLFQAAAEAGVGFIDKKQKDILGSFRPAYSAIAKADELNAILAGDPYVGVKVGTPNWKRAKQLQKEINEQLVQTATAFGQTRLSDSRVRAMTDAYGQSLNPLLGSVKNNIATRNDLQNYILDTVSDKLSNLPESQREMYVKRLELSARGIGEAPAAARPSVEELLFGGKK